MSLKRALVFGATALAVIVAVSCREPTQVMIEVRTNVVHRAGYVTAFTVGPNASLEDSLPTTETREPWGADGFVGSLVVVPGGSDTSPLTVKIVLGVRRDARDCAPPDFAGCIVARRKLRYASHERLRLPITLYAQCEGVPCDAESTCNFLGQCVSATVEQASCGDDEGCTVTGDRPTVVPRPGEDAAIDGAPPDAASDGAPSDGASSDVADTSSDATDASSDSKPDDASGTVGAVNCPPSTCLTGQKCCAYPPNSICVAINVTCAQPSVEIRCDGREDCAPGETCCAYNGGAAQCTTASCTTAGSVELCHLAQDCSAGRNCDPNLKYASIYATCN